MVTLRKSILLWSHYQSPTTNQQNIVLFTKDDVCTGVILCIFIYCLLSGNIISLTWAGKIIPSFTIGSLHYWHGPVQLD